MGRIINDFHLNRCCDLIRDHKSQIIVGNANAHEDKKLTPTVILNPEKDTPLMQEEIFGPILPLITFKTFDEAITYINELDKPLVSYYFGHRTGKNFKRLEKETSSGALVANDTLF